MAAKPHVLPAALLGPAAVDATPRDGAATAGRTPPARRGGSLLWLQGLACGAVVTLATPSAVLLAVLLVPALLAMLLDDRSGRPLVRPVVLAGLAAAVRPLATLWHNGHTMGASIALVSDIGVLAVAWAAEAAAWLLTEIAPVMIRLVLDGRSLTRSIYLRARRAHYEAEWGLASDERTDVNASVDASRR
jgi:hypothetical protein